jgi:hypothetical protein
MEIELWSDSITPDEATNFVAEIKEGIRSIDLGTKSAAFLTNNLTVGQLGWNSELSECHTEISILYAGGAVDIVDVAVFTKNKTTATSVAIQCVDMDGDTTNTYHVLNWIDGNVETYKDLGFAVGVAVGAVYYEMDAK